MYKIEKNNLLGYTETKTITEISCTLQLGNFCYFIRRLYERWDVLLNFHMPFIWDPFLESPDNSRLGKVVL